MPSICFVGHLCNAFCHVEEQFGAHRLETGTRKAVLQILGVYFDSLPNLLWLESIPNMMDQIGKHTVCQWTHGLVNRESITNQSPLVQKLINLGQKDLPKVEIDDMSNGHQKFLSRSGFLARAVLQQPNNNVGKSRQEVCELLRVHTEKVCQKAHCLDLGRDELSKCSSIPDIRADSCKYCALRSSIGMGLFLRFGLK